MANRLLRDSFALIESKVILLCRSDKPANYYAFHTFQFKFVVAKERSDRSNLPDGIHFNILRETASWRKAPFAVTPRVKVSGT